MTHPKSDNERRFSYLVKKPSNFLSHIFGVRIFWTAGDSWTVVWVGTAVKAVNRINTVFYRQSVKKNDFVFVYIFAFQRDF